MHLRFKENNILIRLFKQKCEKLSLNTKFTFDWKNVKNANIATKLGSPFITFKVESDLLIRKATSQRTSTKSLNISKQQ